MSSRSDEGRTRVAIGWLGCCCVVTGETGGKCTEEIVWPCGQ